MVAILHKFRGSSQLGVRTTITGEDHFWARRVQTEKETRGNERVPSKHVKLYCDNGWPLHSQLVIISCSFFCRHNSTIVAKRNKQ